MDVTSQTSVLAAAMADVVRLAPARAFDPVLSGVLLTASTDGLVVAATDRDRSVRLRRPAVVHEPGTVLVPGRPLAETLRALDVPDVRLTVEGSRLAVRTPRARFALPVLDVDLHPGVADPPALAGRAAGGPLLRGLAVAAGAASRDDALPLFSGVHLRSTGDVLRLVATDRYRLAVAELPWRGGPVDVLVPGTLAAEVARQAAGADEIALHVDADRAVLAWADAEVGTALLATPFPDEHRYLDLAGDTTVSVPGGRSAGRGAPGGPVRGRPGCCRAGRGGRRGQGAGRR